VAVFAVWTAVVIGVFTVVITLAATRQIEGTVVTSSAQSMASAVNGMIVHTLSDSELRSLRIDAEEFRLNGDMRTQR
jgi:hypothetical protein